jgi:CubicO group peptidase (beta-lactamase class C family)
MKTWGAVYASNFQGETITSLAGNRRSIDCDTPQKVDLQTQFDVASLTKIVFTTNMVMLAVDQGLLKVDDPVRRYLPAWGSADKERISIRDLLEHQSGLQPWLPLYVRSKSSAEAYEVIVKSKLACEPRKKRIYSDLGFIVLGQILSTIYKSTVAEIFDNNLKGIMGLKNTQFSAPTNSDNVAATSFGDSYEMNMISTGIPYQVSEKVDEFSNWRHHILDGEINDGNAFHLFNGTSSHAGLFSDATDLLNLAGIYLDAFNEDRVFKSRTLRGFLEVGLDPMQCMGFRTWPITTKDGEVIIYGHTGFTGVAFGFSPQLNFSAVMLTNRLHTQSEIIKTDDMWIPFLESSLLRRP